jgi:hypothetical protein
MATRNHKRGRSTRPQQKQSETLAPPALRKKLRLILMQLDTIHSVAEIVFDTLARQKGVADLPVARVVQECIMNALSVQMDQLREMTGEYDS